jgi:hypothetical protein
MEAVLILNWHFYSGESKLTLYTHMQLIKNKLAVNLKEQDITPYWKAGR